jgi:hypothetical protein
MVLSTFDDVATPKTNGADAMSRQLFTDFVAADWDVLRATLKPQIAIGPP